MVVSSSQNITLCYLNNMNVEHLPSPYYSSRRGNRVNGIVLHIMQGSLEGTAAWFRNPKNKYNTSAHYLFGRDGRVIQMVDESKAAHHAGNIYNPSENAKRMLKEKFWGGYINPNWHTIGFECEGVEGTSTDVWSEPMMDSLVTMTKEVAVRHEIQIDNVHVLDHQDIASYKPQMTHWVDEILRRTKKSAVSPTYQIKGSPTVYLPCGDVLVPFETSWQGYLRSFTPEQLVLLSPEEAEKYTITKELAIKEK